MSSFIPTPDAAQGDGGHISSKLILTMVGCLLAFVVIVVGFLLVARKSCCAPHPVHANASLPSYHDAQHTHIHTAATRRGCPVASLRDIRQCPDCLKRGDKGEDRSPRISLESLSLPPPPPPPYPPAAHPLPPSRPRGPTSWISRSASFERPPTTIAAPSTFSTPAPPPPPSYHYASRGPVGGPAPRYRQS
ncbi:hypothetical protein GSI_02883 [Ganoderma sinense ZZ0214-1]|uniref:Uncharacterized protein n=1 Tax=Ganoderma sinense ZZ0214-1 TaxID=1077348 RepID=A0A2G8SMV2_9APHY|nr:hypothetical protein GSI_02883 [Ganoderma sinense ZZ0214-1]